jgi:hypothetical protein
MEDQRLLFRKEEWPALAADVAAKMTHHLRPYRTGLFKHEGDHGTGWGTGSYVSIAGKVFILTNEHVGGIRATKRLVHQFNGQDDMRFVVGDHLDTPWPLDLALLPVDKEAWNDPTNESRAIAISQIAPWHAPVETELLAFAGFSGDRVGFLFDTLRARSTCLTAREASLPVSDALNPQFHFGMDYRPDLATDVIGNEGLPMPPGLSGSTVWNTRFVEAKMSGVDWTPELAQVTGVVWGWPKDILVATRAEYVRSLMLSLFDHSAMADV